MRGTVTPSKSVVGLLPRGSNFVTGACETLPGLQVELPGEPFEDLGDRLAGHRHLEVEARACPTPGVAPVGPGLRVDTETVFLFPLVHRATAADVLALATKIADSGNITR